MKIIHTGDWHLGKLVHGIHMTEDQRHILNQLIDLINVEKPDVLIIAGDIYDRTVPPVEAVELLDNVFSEILLNTETKVLAISGNHDNPDRLGFASSLLMANGLYISVNLKDALKPITLEDEHGTVNFYLIPYIEPAIVKSELGIETIKNHDDAMREIINLIENEMDKSTRNVVVTHGYITGTEGLITSESERPLSIGGTDQVSVDYFEKFNYVALGHIHGPQKVKQDYIRYSGSLMKYSFSEAKQNKSITIVEMGEKGDIEYRYVALEPLRDLRVIKGNLESLISEEIYAKENTEDYLMAILTDRGELIDPIGKLRTVYPNILRVEKESYEREAGKNYTSAGSDFIKKEPIELFEEFYENLTGEKFTDDKQSIVGTIIDNINLERRNK